MRKNTKGSIVLWDAKPQGGAIVTAVDPPGKMKVEQKREKPGIN